MLRVDTKHKKIALSITKAKEDAEKAEMRQYLGKKALCPKAWAKSWLKPKLKK